ncbi:hypothetical protein K503DRAFT_529984 [Rhizopogon vinicolor AM-OR11-026]|uniref:F-box domain-containing protein n=1 Tax=Rhizopogon vinicolor AM-OR11-026 TaxID=1314800 RepID=A0A1B7ML81_9AGAM|nr:hypothetical protein K503DRAFT_529984 [Rhizopogon vinicolor AM-OR11-026]
MQPAILFTFLDLVDFSTKISSLRELASLWRTDFYAKPVFEEVVCPVDSPVLPWKKYVKCGLWWMIAHPNLYIRDCNANGKLSQTWSTHSLTTGSQFLKTVIVNPLQDLLIIVSPLSFIVVDAVQDYQVFMVGFRLASSNLPHPDSASAFLECTYTPDVPGQCASYVIDEPAICGERVIVLYCIHPTQDLFIQVIDWRKGHAKSYPLHQPVGRWPKFRLVDKQTIVFIGEEDLLTLYTLREPDGPPQRRITYHLPKLKYDCSAFHTIHATPPFHSTAARTDLMPGCVPLLESQIMVLEFLSQTWSGIFVTDMVIFSEHAVQSEMPVEIPWSDWGPHHT